MQPFQPGPLHRPPSIFAEAAVAAPDEVGARWVQGALSSVLKHRVSHVRRTPHPRLANGAVRNVTREALMRADHAGITLPSTKAPRPQTAREASFAPLLFESTTRNAVQEATPRVGVGTMPSTARSTHSNAATSSLPAASAVPTASTVPAVPTIASPSSVTPAFDLLALMRFGGLLRLKEAKAGLEDSAASAHVWGWAGGGRATRRIPDYYFEFSNDPDQATTFVPDDVRIEPVVLQHKKSVSLTEMYLVNMLQAIHKEKHSRRGQRVDPDWHRADRGLFPVMSTAEQLYHAPLGADDIPAMREVAQTAHRLQRPLLIMFPGDTLVWVSIDEEVMRTLLAEATINVPERDVTVQPRIRNVTQSNDSDAIAFDTRRLANATHSTDEAMSPARHINATDYATDYATPASSTA